MPGPAGEVGAGVQGLGVLGAGDALADRQQRGELVAGLRPIPCFPGPEGKFSTGDQGAGVLCAERPFSGVENLLAEGPCCDVVPLYPR
jgi:hypothetical protein